MRNALLFAALSLTACEVSDPAVAADASPDTLAAERRCDPAAPFAPPVPVDGVNTSQRESMARLSPDELTMLFAREKTAMVYEVFQATRPSPDVAFGTPVLIPSIDSASSEGWPTMSADGLVLFLASDRVATMNYRTYISRRATLTEPFGTPIELAGTLAGEFMPYLASAESLYFVSPNSSRAGQGLNDIWRASVSPGGTLGTPVPVMGGVNTSDDEVAPTLTADELHIYFRRNVGSEFDIYTASRATTADAFGPASKVPGLSKAGYIETPTWISPDNCNLYLYEAAAGGVLSYDISVARRGSP